MLHFDTPRANEYENANKWAYWKTKAYTLYKSLHKALVAAL